MGRWIRFRREGALVVGRNFLSVSRRWPSLSEGSPGEDPLEWVVEQDVCEGRHGPSCSLGACSKGPLALDSYGPPELAGSNGRCPSAQRRPALWSAQSSCRPHGDLGANDCVRELLHAPEPHGHRDRSGTIPLPGKDAAGSNDDDRPAVLAGVAPLLHAKDSRTARGMRRTPDLPAARSVAVKNDQTARRDPWSEADRTARRSQLTNSRQRLLPRLDLDVDLDDTSRVLGALFHSGVRRGPGEAGAATPPRHSCWLGSPA